MLNVGACVVPLDNMSRSSASRGVGDTNGGNNLSNIPVRAPKGSYQPEDFVFGKLYGTGSYSKVRKAKLRKTGQDYALKIMSKSFIMKEKKEEYVKMERIVLDGLDHPGVVRLMFTFRTNEELFMGMECCEGGELFDQIRQKGKLTLEETRFYAAELVDVLEYIHQYLVHRDIKPENLLLTRDGHLKLIDFGSAKMIQPLPNTAFIQPQAELTAGGTFIGTAAYVSPEVLHCEPVTIGADLWALGCVVYQMLEGKAPFKDETEFLCYQRIMSRDLHLPSHFPPAAKDLIDRLLDLEPEKRPGAGALGYAELKNHPFFDGVDWSRVREALPPLLAKANLLEVSDGEFMDEDEFLDDGMDVAEWEAAHMVTAVKSASSDSATSSMSQSSDSSYARVAQPPEMMSALGDRLHALSTLTMTGVPSSHVISTSSLDLKHGTTLADDCQEAHWQKFLYPGETLLGASLVKKHGWCLTKRRQLMLTDKPRLLYVDPVKMTRKGEIEWSANLIVQVENAFKFSICTPSRRYNLEELMGQAWQWKQTIDGLQQRQSSLCK